MILLKIDPTLTYVFLVLVGSVLRSESRPMILLKTLERNRSHLNVRIPCPCRKCPVQISSSVGRSSDNSVKDPGSESIPLVLRSESRPINLLKTLVANRSHLNVRIPCPCRKCPVQISSSVGKSSDNSVKDPGSESIPLKRPYSLSL